MDTFFDYSPARLVKGKTRWYIEYYQTDPITHVKERFREYLQINRIKDLKERAKVAIQHVNHFNNALLPYGYPFVDRKNLPNQIDLGSAVKLAMTVKSRTDRQKTVSTYQSVVNHFERYLAEKGINQMHLKEFGFIQATDYMDYMLLHKKPKPQTYNNYRLFLTAIWNVLIQRGYAAMNPFSKIVKMKGTEKERRMMDATEANVILSHAWHHDKMMALAILLIHYCFVRPGELRQLRVHHIDLTNGTIQIPGYIAKNKKSESVTIPKSIIPALLGIGLTEWAQNDYIFGANMQPHPDKMIGSNTLTNRHNKITQHLHKTGKLRTTKGITIYSWKDTGAMTLIKSGVDAYEIMRQMRHSDLNMTQKYLKSLNDISASIRDLKISLPF
jgi:integrase